MRKIMRDISGKCETSTRVEKLSLVEYLTNNHKIIRVLGISPEQVSSTVM